MQRSASSFVRYRDLTVIAAAQPLHESSGTLAAWTSPATAPDEVCTKPARSGVYQSSWLFIYIRQNARIDEEDG